jgi:hypothetical protein
MAILHKDGQIKKDGHVYVYSESDLPITTKKQKVIQVKHKTSGKELIVVDTPKWRKKYKQMGFVVQESVNEANVIQKIDKLAKRNKYGTVDGTQMNGKTAREIMAIFKHPKMNSYRNQMLGMKSHELVDLTLRLLKPLKIKVKSD